MYVHKYNRSYDKKDNTVYNSDVFLNGWDTGMAGEKMGGLRRVVMSFPNKGNAMCVILCSVFVELLFPFVILTK